MYQTIKNANLALILEENFLRRLTVLPYEHMIFGLLHPGLKAERRVYEYE